MFYRSYGNSVQGQAEGGALGDPATVTGLRIDKYLVTVGRFRQFVAALGGDDGGGWLPPPGSGKHTHLNNGRGLQDVGSPGLFEAGWDPTDDTRLTQGVIVGDLACDPAFMTWTNTPGANENLPINCANWFEAYAFCIWDGGTVGGYLPSENEFEFAAAGGNQQRPYPWGSADPGTGTQHAIWNCTYGGDGSGCDSFENIAPVGTVPAGAGLWGHLDLSGELNEWILDYNAGYADPCSDCAFLTHSSGREVRGGYFQSSSEIELQSSYRNEGLYPTNNYKSNGFRCARPPT